MFVQVGLDLTVFDSVRSADEPWRSAGEHRAAVRLLRRHGVVRVASDSERERLREVVLSLPDQLQKIWAMVVEPHQGIVLCCDPPVERSLHEIEDIEELAAAYEGQLEVALVDGTRATLYFEFDDHELHRRHGELEVTRFAAASDSPTLEQVSRVTAVPADTDRDTVARHFIMPAVRTAPKVAIVDRYAGLQLVASELHGERGHRGASWFLAQIHRAPKAYVTLYTALGQGGTTAQDMADAVKALSARLGSGGIRHLRLLVADEPGALAHDRHVRFGERVAVQLGSGLDSFSPKVTPGGYTFAPFDVSEAKRRERIDPRVLDLETEIAFNR